KPDPNGKPRPWIDEKIKVFDRAFSKFEAFRLIDPDKGDYVFGKKALKCLLIGIGPVHTLFFFLSPRPSSRGLGSQCLDAGSSPA
ncbi:MAG: hypothetical protein ACYSOJ_04050, partial [Planctomycetota bacterium]